MKAKRQEWTCPECDAPNDPPRRTCSSCGAARRATTAARDAGAGSLRRCPVDGAGLRADGYCEAGYGWPQSWATRSTGGDGYQISSMSPFACPVCRAQLAWSGACFRCFGQLQSDDPRNYPGDRYDLIAGHMVMGARGPQRVVSWEEGKAAAAAIIPLLEQIGRGLEPAEAAKITDQAHHRMASALVDYPVAR